MNIKTFYKGLVIGIAILLICGVFFLLISDMDIRIRVLDTVMASLIFVNLSLFLFFPLFSGDDEKKEAGMIGIHLFTTSLSSLLVIATIILGYILGWSFKLQLFIHLAIIILILLGRVATLHAGEKVVDVFEKENRLMEGKKNLMQMAEVIQIHLKSNNILAEANKQRIKEICQNIRFLSPVDSEKAVELDIELGNCLNQIMQYIKQSVPEQLLEPKITDCESLYTQRKQIAK